MDEENKILVIYVGVGGIRSVDIEDFVGKISQRISPSTFKGEIIIIPTQSYDTRIECINPKYITDIELIKENTETIKKLQEELQNQLKQIKEKNNE
ncbi:hypothetical protein M0Q97_09620 [Candidatus Dojkabacteria bacterium]|jgi:hypothetical protein|nr:hypothetical protein [Candidatus Dojkabacteria bacterium]